MSLIISSLILIPRGFSCFAFLHSSGCFGLYFVPFASELLISIMSILIRRMQINTSMLPFEMSIIDDENKYNDENASNL